MHLKCAAAALHICGPPYVNPKMCHDVNKAPCAGTLLNLVTSGAGAAVTVRAKGGSKPSMKLQGTVEMITRSCEKQIEAQKSRLPVISHKWESLPIICWFNPPSPHSQLILDHTFAATLFHYDVTWQDKVFQGWCEQTVLYWTVQITDLKHLWDKLDCWPLSIRALH